MAGRNARARARALARERAASAHPRTALAPLPLALALTIFALLPVDQRLRCLEVCRGWRATLVDHSVWTHLDLSRTSGVPRRAATDALLRAAAARARGGLRSLDVSGCRRIRLPAVCAVLEAAASLQTVRIYSWRTMVTAAGAYALLRAAPKLPVIKIDLFCSTAAEAQRALSSEPPFGPLRVRTLSVCDATDADAVLSLAGVVAQHSSLQVLQIRCCGAWGLPVLDAIVDAALRCRLLTLDLWNADLSPECVQAVARLLINADALVELAIDGLDAPLLDEPAAVVLGSALLANKTLTTLSLRFLRVWRDAAVASALLGVLTLLANLRTLSLASNYADDEAQQAAAGVLLGVLVAANLLEELDVSFSQLGDVGLGPLVDALPHSTHLRCVCFTAAATESATTLRATACFRRCGQTRRCECWSPAMTRSLLPLARRRRWWRRARSRCDANGDARWFRSTYPSLVSLGIPRALPQEPATRTVRCALSRQRRVERAPQGTQCAPFSNLV